MKVQYDHDTREYHIIVSRDMIEDADPCPQKQFDMLKPAIENLAKGVDEIARVIEKLAKGENATYLPIS